MTLVDAARPAPAPSNVAAIVLLAAQAFALGLMVAWVTIAASAIFLDTYASGALPATYLGAAAAGALASATLTKAFRRRSLMWVAMWVLAGLAVALSASRASRDAMHRSLPRGCWRCAGMVPESIADR